MAAVACLLVVAALAGLAGLRVRSSADDLADAVALVDAASAALTDGRIGDARSALDRAYDLVSRANSSLYGVADLELSQALPIVGANLDAVRDAVGLATRLVDGGRRVLAAASPLEGASGQLEVSLSDGTLPLGAVGAAQVEIASLLGDLPAEAPDHSSVVLPAVEEAATTLYREADRRRDQLRVLDRGLSLLAEMAGGNGPRRYLVAVANIAEMRGSGGMILSYGVLEGVDGVIDLTAFGRIDELPLGGPVAADLAPSDYLARWAGFDPLSRWRQANLAGDFSVVAPVLQAMFEASTGSTVDGVIQIDPVGLAAILDGVGPVTVPELGEIRADNVAALTLNEAYVRFPGVEDRSDVLGDVAEAAFRRLVDGEIPSLRTLAERLAEAVDGRHLLVQARPGVQGLLTSLGADGSYPPLEGPDAVALTAQNLAGNKLDYYLDTSLSLSGERPPGALGALEAEVTLTNTGPPGALDPAYVFGPGPTAVPLPAGVIRSLVTLYLPLGSSLERASGDVTVEPATSGTEGGRPYASFIVDVPAGQERSVVLSLRLAPRPPGPYSIDLVPSPRVRPTRVRVDVRAGDDEEVVGSVTADRWWRFSTEGAPEAVPAPAHR